MREAGDVARPPKRSLTSLCVARVLVGHKPGEPVGRTRVHVFGALAHLEKVLLLPFLQGELVFEELGLKKKKRDKTNVFKKKKTLFLKWLMMQRIMSLDILCM